MHFQGPSPAPSQWTWICLPGGCSPFSFLQDQICCESTSFWSSSAQTGLGLRSHRLSGVLSNKVPSGIWGAFFPVSSACDHTFPNMGYSSFTALLPVSHISVSSQCTTLREWLWRASDPCWGGGGVEASVHSIWELFSLGSQILCNLIEWSSKFAKVGIWSTSQRLWHLKTSPVHGALGRW